MDGWWNPRRVNCWPLHVRLGDTLALPWPRKSMHPFVLSRYQPLPRAPAAATERNPSSLRPLCPLTEQRQPSSWSLDRPRVGVARAGCRRRPATALCISHRTATNSHPFSSPFAQRFFRYFLLSSSLRLARFAPPSRLPSHGFPYFHGRSILYSARCR